ncbi:MAG: L-threonylcarbamoyladenylate synthase [Saccharofermentanales bacterium]
MTELQTIVVEVDPVNPDDSALLPAAELLRAGQLVAFPTETVYGLGADAFNPEAVRAIFTAKGRPADNPLIVHVASTDELADVVRELSPLARLLIEKFMPGPLTLVLPRSARVPDIVTAGLDTVAVRLPEHPVARRLIELAGVPLAAPSANRSGRPSPTLAKHVLEDMKGRIPMIVDGGPSDFGVESTVLDVTGSVPVILRPGAVTIEELQEVAGEILTVESAAAAAQSDPGTYAPVKGEKQTELKQYTNTLESAPRSPGMKYRHYAPRTPLCIAEGNTAAARSNQLLQQVLAAIAAGKTPAVFTSRETIELLRANLPEGWHLQVGSENENIPAEAGSADQTIWAIVHGPGGQARTAASHLFAALRWLDTRQADLIIAESADSTGIGAAYLNRLHKAAGGGAEPVPTANCNCMKKETAMKLLFICTGNTCRSPMAAYLFNHFSADSGHSAESAGLAARNGDSISENARLVLEAEYGIDASDHRSRLFELELAAGFDRVLTMNSSQRDYLRSLLPDQAAKIMTIGEAAGLPAEAVEDPFGQSREIYLQTARQLERLIKLILEQLNKNSVE